MKKYREFRYRYTNPKFLEFLVNILGEEKVEASVFLQPHELFGELGEERKKFRRMNEETLEENIGMYKEFLEKMRKSGIIPGWSLCFDYEIRQNDNPNIKKTYHHHRRQFGTFKDVSNVSLVDPLNFFGNKWEGISFINFLGRESIQKLKEAVPKFVSAGYTITSVYGGLNPQPYTSDHYYDRIDYDGHLSAGNGLMTINGNFPEDFDFRDLVPKKLRGSQKMLEDLTREHNNPY